MALDPALSSRLTDQENRYGVSVCEPVDLVCVRADGVYLWDLEGNRYLDGWAGQGTVNQGHCHTRIAAAMVEQCLRLCLTSRTLRNDRLPAFLEKLCTFTGFDQALLLNSGTEAVQAALRGAQAWGCRHKGLEPDQGETISFLGHWPGSGARPTVPYGDLEALRVAVGPHTCAVLVEPVQGGAGVTLPPKGFLRALRELCDRRGLLLIADEVQTGLGRTGRVFACDHEGVRPDATVLGKALSGGFYPVSALLGTREFMTGFTGTGASTYGGNPLACAVASAALDVLTDEKLVERAAELGAYLQERLRAMDSPHLRTVHGLGLWASLHLHPEAGGARRFAERLRQEGLLCLPGGEHTLTLSPPLVINREQLDWALDKLRLVLA